MWNFRPTNELYHYGVKGMRWGVRKDRSSKSYKSKGIRAAVARRGNEKVDKGFKKWNDNAKLKSDAIALGKNANLSKLAYEQDRSNITLKKQAKSDTSAYKKALSKNTTWRKGDIKAEVGKDLSRKYLSEAKKVEKKLQADPNNKALSKQYDSLRSKHAVERAKARRAPMVAQNRSYKKASIKRGITIGVKAATASATVAVGVTFANRYLSDRDFRWNGQPVRLHIGDVRRATEIVRAGAEFLKYF